MFILIDKLTVWAIAYLCIYISWSLKSLIYRPLARVGSSGLAQLSGPFFPSFDTHLWRVELLIFIIPVVIEFFECTRAMRIYSRILVLSIDFGGSIVFCKCRVYGSDFVALVKGIYPVNCTLILISLVCLIYCQMNWRLPSNSSRSKFLTLTSGNGWQASPKFAGHKILTPICISCSVAVE